VAPRVLNLLLVGWMFASAVLWRHGPVEQGNVVVCATLVALFELAAVEQPLAGLLTAAVAAWLVISAFTLSHARPWTELNDLLVGVALLAGSIWATEHRRHRHLQHG
jgi:hypothetical protein